MVCKEFTNDSLETRKENLLQKLQENQKLLEELLDQPSKTYENFLVPYQKMNHDLESLFTEISHLHSVKNSPQTQEIYSSILGPITEYHTNLAQDERIYKAYQEILKKMESNGTHKKEAIKVLKDGIRHFELSGVHLEKEKKLKIKEIQIQLSNLSNQFSQNLLNATNSYIQTITNPNDVEGLPESDKALAKKPDGTYQFTLQAPSYLAYMTYGPNRSIREELYKAYVTRAPENGKILEEILKLRKELSLLLGFSNYAEYSLAYKMAESTQQVLDFLYNLAKKAKPQAIKEFEELKEFAKNQGLINLEAFDVLYYSELLKKQKFNFYEEEYRPYFEKNSTIHGVFQFLEKFFQISFQKVHTYTWDPTVEVFDIYKNGSLSGRLYTDLEARNDKKSGAWMHNWISRHRSQLGLVPPSAFIVANFPPSTGDIPSLLKPTDVVTFLHEMGHALHHLLTEVEEPFVSGIHGVEWDAVEFPSQFLENFFYSEEALPFFARHYKTNELLPKDMLEKLIQVKNFQSGMATVRQLEFAIFDMLIHIECPNEEGVQKILDKVREEVAVIHPPSYNRFQNSFTHIFSGGYAAGYYSYKWAELLSANAYFKVVDNGVFQSGLGPKYVKEVLSKGGSQPAMELFKNFYGKEPELQPLLRLLSIPS